MSELRALRRTIGGVRVSNLFDTAGKPFGWTHHKERAIIREHLKRRGRWNDARDEFLVTSIQQRLHRYDKRYRELQELHAKARPPVSGASLGFTWEELERIAEHFAGANDPVTINIATKAKLALDQRNDHR
jgi:hypothetical protein